MGNNVGPYRVQRIYCCNSLMRSKFITTLIASALLVVPVASSTALLRSEQIPTIFSELTNAKALANPAMVLIDLKSGETIFNREADQLRKPASTLKLMSAFAALEFLPAETTFSTEIYQSSKNTFEIFGNFDPSITPSAKLAKNLKFLNSDTFVNHIRKVAKSRRLTIKYYGITYRTMTNMNSYFRRVGYRINWVATKQTDLEKFAHKPIYKGTSPNLSQILNYTLLFSDNWVADYLAKSAAVAAGYGYSPAGISAVFQEVLARYGIKNSQIEAADGSGLSHEDRTTARTLAEVLIKMNENSKFSAAISGLPVGGISGTLQHRFIKSAPNAVGLVQAKTGSLDGVVSLAGFVDSGDRKYVFAIIADHIRRGYSSESAARSSIDKLLGKIAAPIKSETASEVTPTPSPEKVA